MEEVREKTEEPDKEDLKEKDSKEKDSKQKDSKQNDFAGQVKEKTSEKDTKKNIADSKEICNPEQFWKRKQENKQNNENAEYHNCIFLDGKDISNFVFNSGEINGAISQHRGTTNGESEKVRFQTPGDLKKFIETYSMEDYTPVLLSVLVLKIVPVSYLYPIAGALREQVKASGTETGAEKKSEILLSLEDILDRLGAGKVTATIKNEAGEMEVQCVTLQEYGVMQESALAVWENYPGLREGLLQWLLRISRVKEYRQMILYQIVRALADFAAFDFPYAKNHIISLFTRNENKDDFYFLKETLKGCLKSEAYSQNADALLCHWCKLDNNDFLWKIALALADEEAGYGFCDLLRQRLDGIIKRELEEGIAMDSEPIVYLFQGESDIPFRILQENPAAATVYLKTLAQQFEECRTRQEQMRFGYYFVTLMWQDYLAEDYPDYRSLFIDSVNHKNVSEKMGALLKFIWQRQTLRESSIEPVLGMYIKEYEDRHVSWAYMKRFLRLLAFTGREADYMYTKRMLNRIGRHGGNAIPREMQDYLEGLLKGRKKG